jgi:exoribonuclease-2
MFKNNAALLALRQTLIDQAPPVVVPPPALVVEGRVTAHPKGFGFLRVDASTSYFITPNQMKHCLPGDLVRAKVIEEGEGKSNAEIEAILEQGMTQLLGTVRFKGENYFIVPENKVIKSWFFIPHSMRGDQKDGDVVKATMTQHPFKSGKAQARISQTIGHESDKDIIWQVALARNEIAPRTGKSANDESTDYIADDEVVEDLRYLPFVTIDGESTQDMDDAVYAEKHPDKGWWLWKAIADVDSHLVPGSPVDRDALARGVTTYLPGMVVPMLPHSLSEREMSLVKGQIRNVLCAKMHIGRDGSLIESTFFPAIIVSRSKLTYQAVNEYVTGEFDLRDDEDVKASIQNLYWLSKARQVWRRCHALVAEDGRDYRLSVSDYELNSIISEERNDAHKLIEECAVVANVAYAQEMIRRGVPFISRRQSGFGEDSFDKIKAIAKVLDVECPDAENPTFEQVYNLLSAVNQCDQEPLKLSMRSVMQRSEYSQHLGYHASLGLPEYATWTSPIRKFSDLINHRQMKAVLRGQPPLVIDDELVDAINKRTKAASRAEREVVKNLYCRHLSFRSAETFQAKVVSLRPKSVDVEIQGLGVRAKVPGMAFSTRDDVVTLNDVGTELSVNNHVMLTLGQMVTVVFDLKKLEEQELEVSIRW